MVSALRLACKALSLKDDQQEWTSFYGEKKTHMSVLLLHATCMCACIRVYLFVYKRVFGSSLHISMVKITPMEYPSCCTVLKLKFNSSILSTWRSSHINLAEIKQHKFNSLFQSVHKIRYIHNSSAQTEKSLPEVASLPQAQNDEPEEPG